MLLYDPNCLNISGQVTLVWPDYTFTLIGPRTFVCTLSHTSSSYSEDEERGNDDEALGGW